MDDGHKLALRTGFAVTVLGALAWLAVLVATRMFPSPARETRFVDAHGAVGAERVRCHGMIVADGPRIWSVCEGPAGDYLGRFDTRSGTSTLLGPLAPNISGMIGAVRGPGSTRVFAIGGTLVEASGDTLRTLDSTTLLLGLARVGDGVEVVEAGGPSGFEVRRYEDSRLAQRRDVVRVFHSSEEREVSPEHAWHDGRAGEGWRVVWSDHPRSVAVLPLEVTIREQTESVEVGVVGTLALDERLVARAETGAVFVGNGWLYGGSTVIGSLGRAEVYVRRGGGLERVAFGRGSHVELAGVALEDGPRARWILTDSSGRRVWFDGQTLERVIVDGRLSALRVGDRTGPPVVASFWVDTGFRVVPDGADYIMLGGLGGAYVHVDHDLRRTDALSFAERFARLFVEDRAKRNADWFSGVGGLRSATVPFMLAGPLVGLVGLALARRRPRVATGISVTWLALALAGAWHFLYVLRFYW